MKLSLLKPIDDTAAAEKYVRSIIERQMSEVPATESSQNVPVGIIGGGLMGTAIAATHLKARISVHICDNSKAVLTQLPRKIAAELVLQGMQGNSAQIDNFVSKNLKLVSDSTQLPKSGILIETIPEKLKLKQKLLRQIEANGFDGLLFSNTSTIEVSKIAEQLTNKNRFAGFHFFHPVRNRSLLEIVRGSETSQEAVDSARQHARKIDKLPLVVADGPGFLVNRILNPLLRESLALFDEGIEIGKIDETVKRFGMPMGPFRIIDEIGLDVVLHAGWVLGKAFPNRAYNSEILLKMIDLGRLGRKTGKGFWKYDSNTSWEGDGTFDTEIEHFTLKRRAEFDEETIVRRLFLPMLAEAVQAVEDGITKDLWEADLAVVMGLGFPISRGGLCFWAESIGWETMLREMQTLEERFGPRFAPPRAKAS